MPFNLPVMPYEMNSLEPHISSETLEFHYGKLHQSYINNLNGLTEGTDLIDMPIEKIIMNSKGGIYNNATQVWNHTFYWNCMSPNGGGIPLNNNLVSAIDKSFGSFSEFKVEFSISAASIFGSGWTWLAQNNDGQLEIYNSNIIGCPMTSGKKALLNIDVWEHAYYLDYKHNRAKYIEAWWELINWDYVSSQFDK